MRIKYWGRKIMSWELIPVLLALLIYTPTHAEEKALTAPVLLMGDSQEHERHGTFAWVAGDQVDKFAKVAARSPQMDFYTKYSMADVVKTYVASSNKGETKAAEAAFAIHLGDFLDISCESEWRRFLLVSEDDIKSGRMVLGVGNHDGFYIGNFSFKTMKRPWLGFLRLVEAAAWRGRCYAGEGSEYADTEKNIFHKGELVKRLADLLPSVSEEQPPIAKDLCPDGMVCGAKKVSTFWTVYYQYPKYMNENNGDLDTQQNYWRSYIVSEVCLPQKDSSADVRIILMDPSQSSVTSNSIKATALEQLFKTLKFPDSTTLPIINGHIESDQRKLVEALLASPCSIDGSTKHCLRILAGHHPLSDYGTDSWKWLKNLITTESKQGKPRVLNLYISAHTHTGYIKESKDNDGINEINVGALIENSPHYRTFWLAQDSDNRYIVYSEQYNLTDNKRLHDSCPITNWKYLKEFYEPRAQGVYNDKFAYLEQSRREFKQAFERLKDAQNSGTPEAVALWNEESAPGSKLLSIHAQMLEWSEKTDASAIRAHCVYKSREYPQTEYWEKSHYQSIESVIHLLDDMEKVTRKWGEDPHGMDCYGGNAQDGYYLAYTETRFLSLLQDWFEKIDDKAFIIKGRETEAGYRVCSARLAAEQNRITDENPVNLDPSTKKSFIQL
ncbi:MAG: hypothetical protein C4581_10895 [Nitrospiraceae bacterium]|nr:MAG: hypothetical protein C4581_10895 [Nitrospiraceae bacterium]